MASHMYTHTHTHTVHCLWHGRLVASSDCEAVWERFLPRSYRKDWLSILLQGMFMYSGLQACVMALTPLHSVQWRTVVSSQSRQKRFLDCSVGSLCSPTLRRESITLIGRYVPAIIRFSSPAVTCIVLLDWNPWDSDWICDEWFFEDGNISSRGGQWTGMVKVGGYRLTPA